ncbi:PAS domain S-box protein [Sphingobacterium sp.]|uniref:PAS domain-containing sensor histidine kinase n=1 Tax=Sphingobacterium sp. TaxID=341027 RepID=UPI0031E0539A
MEEVGEDYNLFATAKKLTSLTRQVDELSDFIEMVTVPLLKVNQAGIIIWGNQASRELLEDKRADFIGLPVQQFYIDDQTIGEITKALLQNKSIHDSYQKLKCANGTIKHVLINSNAFFQEDKFAYSRWAILDITKSVEEEKKRNNLPMLLQEREERLRLAMEAADLGTWDWDFTTGKILLSKEVQKILNVDTDLQSIDSLINLIHISDREKVRSILDRVSQSNSDEHFNFACRIQKLNSGDIIWISVQAAVFFSNSKRTKRVIGTLFDITNSKLSERKDAQLVAIVNSSYDAIIGKNLDGVVTSWNDAAEQIFGYGADEMIGQNILKLIPEERHSEEDYILERLRSGMSIKHYETVRRRKNGKLFDVSLTISPIKNGEGQIVGISKIARDISDRKEEERRKNDFVSMLSHELKTPLASVLLYSQVLQVKYRQQNDHNAIQLGRVIENQAKKMNDMVGDFLSMARIEERKLQIRKEVFDLNNLLEEIKLESKLLCSDHKITMVQAERAIVYADRNKIGQVLTNLISNAIKYSPNGGEIIFGCRNENGQIYVFVKDHGIGISKKDQEKLFERFYRVENDEVSNISGFGIGLYIVSEFLRYHDATIEVESEKGAGTIFSFVLKENGQ